MSNELVSVSVSLSKASVTAAGFGVPLIAGPSNHWSDRFRAYTSLTGMTGDGFLTSDPEYIAASIMLSAVNPPSLFLIGRRLPAGAQQDTITINTDTNGDTYQATVNGTLCTYTSLGTGVNATATGLAAAIQAQNATTHVTAAAVGAVVTLTAAVPGNAFTCVLGGTGSALMTLVNPSVANQGLQEDLTAFRNAGAVWYATMITSRSNVDILNGAAWTQANATPPTIFMPQSSEAISATNAPTVGADLANALLALKYTRTGLWWHSNDAEYLDAGILGRELPVDPGNDFWGLKTIVGVSPEPLSFSQTQKNNLVGSDVGLGKNANMYYSITAQNAITQRGTMASGDWIDVIRFLDFLVARISEAASNLMLSQERVELDDFGIAQLGAQVTGVLQAAKDARKITSFYVNMPTADQISSSDRMARRLNPPITFGGQCSGAFGHANFAGNITE